MPRRRSGDGSQWIGLSRHCLQSKSDGGYEGGGKLSVMFQLKNNCSKLITRHEYAKTHVGKGASIGPNATIVCGHDIGAFAFIGAGAVVTKTVPDYALVVGNPARQIGWMSEYGHRLEFDNDGFAVCPESKECYKLESGLVKKLISTLK